MMDKEPLIYPSRHRLTFNPAVPDKQAWAIGMVIVQWGMTDHFREQSIYNLMGDDRKLIGEYKRLRSSVEKTKFWKTLVETKMRDAERAKNLQFITRFETLNGQRDDIVHRMWGGGIQAGTLGAPENAPTTDAAMHRNPDERVKTKSTDARRHLRWRLTYAGLREIARNISQLNHEIIQSWIPPEVPPGMFHLWAFEDADGRLVVGVASATESDPHLKD
jgi:hypothetical protein